MRNRDHCGRCRTIHGGNNHLCPVHGPVSDHCCRPDCDRNEWALLEEPDGRRTRPVRRIHIPETAISQPNSWRQDGRSDPMPVYRIAA